MEIGSRIHSHVFVFKFSWSKPLFHALVYTYMTLSFTNLNIMFRSCIYTLSSLLLTFLYFKTLFTKFSKFKNPADFSVSGLTGRPARSTGASVWTCTFVHVCRPTARVDRLSAVALGFSGSTARVDRPQNTSFCLRGRSTRPVDPSPTALCQQSWRPTGPVDRQACKSPTALSSFVQF